MIAPESGVAPSTGSGTVDGPQLVDAIAAAVKACEGVDDLYSSTTASIASYLPGRQVVGVRVAADAVTVQVRIAWSVPVDTVAARIQLAVAPLGGGRRVDVVVADITNPPDATNGKDLWTTNTAPPAVPSSAPTIPIVAGTRPPS